MVTLSATEPGGGVSSCLGVDGPLPPTNRGQDRSPMELECAYPSKGPLPERDEDRAALPLGIGISGGRFVVMPRNAPPAVKGCDAWDVAVEDESATVPISARGSPRMPSARGLVDVLLDPGAHGKSRRHASSAAVVDMGASAGAWRSRLSASNSSWHCWSCSSSDRARCFSLCAIFRPQSRCSLTFFNSSSFSSIFSSYSLCISSTPR
mmetsp:Transcript_70307/g.139351  ORF Transcript_70307/g.139351 Transcript_70307/m.139351 type:complete len:208 (+) Transcript_70307:700-1323(+)